MKLNQKRNQRPAQTINSLVYEGRIAGIDFFGILDMTQIEIQEFIKVVNERSRRDYQHKSLIAFTQAQLTALWVWKNDEKDISDAFPYWTDEEKNEIKVNKIKKQMYKLARNTNIERK